MAQPSLTNLAYKTLQQGKGLAGLIHKELSGKLMEIISPESIPKTEPISRDLLIKVRKAISELEKQDWNDAEKGIYPKSLLFDAPWIEWAKQYPLIWLDMPSTWRRRKEKKTRDIPKQINQNIYPDYYLQNFHHQTDGYLSDHSASLYDLQVEILFNGTADAMRRRVIEPLKEGLKRFDKKIEGDIHILDVATGTGRTLKQIRAACPKAELIGIDLSESYLKKASKYLSYKNKNLAQLIRGNAEKLPFADNSMQAVTCVFLMHELPRKARQNVIHECWRVLEPDGILVLADSVQINDSPQFCSILEDFHKVFHEPYYRDYITDDITERLSSEGFHNINANSYFMTRVWSAYKPVERVKLNQEN